MLRYASDFNWQTGYADHSAEDGRAFRIFAEAGTPLIRAGAGYEEYSGRRGSHRPFDTLLGTGHRFNGYADQFTKLRNSNLARGLRERFASIRGRAMTLTWRAAYHQFDQETGSRPYGSELDLTASLNLTETLTGLVQFARYSADSPNDSGVAATDDVLLGVLE